MQTKEELQEMYRKMAEWSAFVRRHNANIFDVSFSFRERLAANDF